MLYVNLHKRKHQVHKEIPNSYNTNGKQLGNIEIPAMPAYQKPDYHRIHSQTNNREKEKPGIFDCQFRVIAVKRPPAI